MGKLAVFTFIFLMTSTMVACASISDSPSTGRCRVKFAEPYRPVVTSGMIIRGQASAVCTGRIDKHHVTLSLETSTDGRWQVKEEDSSDKIPYPRAVNLLVVTDCRPGTWRLRYTVRATHEGKTDSKSDASDELDVRSQKDCERPK